MRIETLDLEFQGTPETIAAFLVVGPDGPVLVETGPGSTLENLLARLAEHGFQASDVRHVLVTHIHLDHSGAAGWWARQGSKVYVHPAGAPHLIAPQRLLDSAGRIYGDRMDVLWGETLAAPEDRVVAVEDGQVIEAGGLEFTALATPGHARHHHVYRLGDVVFSGDAAGIRLGEREWIDLPAPPPEFDLEVWKETLERLRAQEISTVYRTHFGPTRGLAGQLDVFEALLEDATGFVGDLMRRGVERDEILELYSDRMRQLASDRGIDDETARAYELANPRSMSVDGIARYWRKRSAAAAG